MYANFNIGILKNNNNISRKLQQTCPRAITKETTQMHERFASSDSLPKAEARNKNPHNFTPRPLKFVIVKNSKNYFSKYSLGHYLH
jgi:hypothetical protein